MLCFDGSKKSCRSGEALILSYKWEPLSQMVLDHRLSSAVVFPFDKFTVGKVSKSYKILTFGLYEPDEDIAGKDTTILAPRNGWGREWVHVWPQLKTLVSGTGDLAFSISINSVMQTAWLTLACILSCSVLSDSLEPTGTVCSLSGSSAHGISQARITGGVPCSSPRDIPD